MSEFILDVYPLLKRVKEIEERVNHKNLKVSTIHDFLWDNIKHFQKEIKNHRHRNADDDPHGGALYLLEEPCRHRLVGQAEAVLDHVAPRTPNTVTAS